MNASTIISHTMVLRGSRASRLEPRAKTVDEIIREVADKYGLTYEQIISPRRMAPLMKARFEAYWRCIKETTLSTPKIGVHFGDRDHTTILYGARQHEKRMKEQTV